MTSAVSTEDPMMLPAFAPLRLDPAYKAVSSAIELRIMEGRLLPGEALPSENDLAQQFGVNRSTVREGIRQLESEGLVRRVSRKKLVASIPGQGDLAPRTSRAMLLHKVSFRELWEVAMALEPLASALASQAIEPEDVLALENNLAKTREVVASGGSPVVLDVEFHSIIARAAANKALLLAREPVGLLLYPAFTTIQPLLPQAGRRLIEAHEQIVAALRAGDGDGARLWMTRHIKDFRRGWELSELDLDQPLTG
jgi:DNA-binding FadR family transcriptional regulator